jgi:16S rRNA (adenine1518-N6/adenine1519-N6)-dimethyltransferase
MNVRISPDFVAAKLRQLGVRPQHQLGQNFLVDEGVLAAVLAGGQVLPGDVVVEVGPGLGVLTSELLTAGATVHAIEFDPQMAALLHEDFAEAVTSGKLVLHEGDAVKLIPELIQTLPKGYKVVANVPYQITTPLFQVFLQDPAAEHRPVLLSLLVQKELAQRLCAKEKTGERSYLSVLTQYFTAASILKIVPPTAFMPSPKVDSAVLQLVAKDVLSLPTGEEKQFLRFVKTAFQERRKQLKNVIAGIKARPTTEVGEWLVSHNLPVTVRAQELTEADWLTLYHDRL